MSDDRAGRPLLPTIDDERVGMTVISGSLVAYGLSSVWLFGLFMGLVVMLGVLRVTRPRV